MDTIITLLHTTYTKDSYGILRQQVEERETYARIDSVSRTEFYEGGRNGLNPEFRFTVFHDAYRGETLCKYMGKSYSIYRTYIVPGTDYIELYVQREGGSNGKGN